MKLKAIGTVQVADKEGNVTEHKPGSIFTVADEAGQALIDARHAEKPSKEKAEPETNDAIKEAATPTAKV